mmetsp:Transcript_17813/g.27708  ORF Transcript_17813/g.27708 Transcript_17813/m.27708 type:complete len:382 (-) Transcript_17813:136-1281(-)
MITSGSATGIGNVVICGAGVIGTSIAYHLAKLGVPSRVIDPVGLAPAASGKAGGFLALDWNAGPLDELSRRSFHLHEKLAQDLDLDDKCYRRLRCEAVAVDGSDRVVQPSQKKLQGLNDIDWADVGVVGSRCLGTTDTIAQTHPKLFVEALWRDAEKLGCEMLIHEVDDVQLSSDGKSVTGVKIKSKKNKDGGEQQDPSEGEVIPADVVIIAMGPWSSRIKSLPVPQLYGQKYHSAILRPKRVLDQAVFFQGLGDPEVYPRPDGDVYVCGYPDSPVIIQEEPGSVQVRPEAVDRLINVAGKLSTELAEAEVVRNKCSSCHLPVTANGMPAMGPFTGVKGAYIATGHSCWGILNAPASGEAMAELIVNGETSHVDLRPFYPR